MSPSHLPRKTKDRSGAWSDASLLPSADTKRGVEVTASGPTSGARERAIPCHPQTFVTRVGSGKTILQCRKNQILFGQGDPADAVFYIQEGRVALTVVSPQGKQAVLGILEPGFFVGETCLAGQTVRRATALSLDASTIVRIEKAGMIRALHDDPSFFELFMSRLMTRSVRVQEDLVDQLFHSAEKRLARRVAFFPNVGQQQQRSSSCTTDFTVSAASAAACPCATTRSGSWACVSTVGRRRSGLRCHHP